MRDDVSYRLLTVRLYARGVVERTSLCGEHIGTKHLYRTQGGDFLFSKIDARNGAWGFVPDDLTGAVVSSDFPILRLNATRVDRDFLTLAMSRPDMWTPLRDIAVGTTNRRRIQTAELLQMDVALPPLLEQRAIVDALQSVRRAGEATGAVISATRELEYSLMRHLFMYGPVPLQEAERVLLRETQIGSLPQYWAVAQLGSVSTISTGTTPSTSRAEYYSGDIPFVKTSEIANSIIAGASTHISAEAVEDYSLKLYPPGTVLLAMYGQGKTRGQTSLLGISAATTQNTAAISPSERLDSAFLWFYLLSRYGALRSEGIQGHIPHLNLGYVRRLPVPLPPLDEQRAISRTLMAVIAKVNAERSTSEALASVFDSLLSALMTGQVRLGTTEAAGGGG